MRVAHIMAHGSKNGVATSCLDLIRAQQRHGHEILLATVTGGWLTRQDFADDLTMVESHLKTRPREIARVGWIIRDWKPTVIHCHGSKANKYGLVYRFAAGSPVLTTAHSRHIQLPFAFMRAVIAPSRQTADYHHRKNLVPGRKLTVIPNLLDTRAPAAAARTQCRAELGISEDEFVIGIVGGVGARKNQVDGMRILEKVLARHPETRLVIVGGLPDGEPMPGWNAMLARPEIADRVILTGFREDAPALIESFDTLICTSRIEEGPMVVFEAMSLRRPVVSYAVGMVPDILRDGIDGFINEVGDVAGAAENICRLIEDRDLRERIADQGRRRIDDALDEKKILQQIDAVYERVARAAGTWNDAAPAA